MKPTSRSRTQYWQLFTFLLVICFVLMIGDTRGWWDEPRDIFERYVVLRQVNHTENEQEKLANLDSKVISLESEKQRLNEENIDLRKQLEAPLPPNLKFILSYVISLEVSQNDAVLKVAGGERDGVKTGMPVFSENILIGIVESTTPRISTITLLSSPKIKVAVKTSKGASGLIVGANEENRPTSTILDRVLQTETLTAGDIVVTSGEDGLPVNSLVGEVSFLVSEAREPFQKASITLIVNPHNLKRVFIAGEF